MAATIALVLALLSSRAARADEPPRARRAVTLVVVGSFPAPLVDAVAAALAAEYGVTVERHAALALPRVAWYPDRRRWRAERILAWLDGAVAGDRVLALTDVDISTAKAPYDDWGVFGLGEIGGHASVLSDFRLKRRVTGEAHLRRRVVAVALHEIGHTLGLPHCTETAAKCIMLDAEGSIRTVDETSGHLGPACRKLLAALAP